MNRPMISIDETARKNRMPILRSATPIPGERNRRVKISMHG
jgi:hypothetical protein